MKKWIQYKSMFYRVGRNMLDAKVFNNEILVEGDGICTVKAMGRAREQELEGRLKLLNLRDFLGEDNMMKSKNEIDLMFGTRTTFVEFFRLRNEIARLKANIEHRSRLSRRLKLLFFLTYSLKVLIQILHFPAIDLQYRGAIYNGPPDGG